MQALERLEPPTGCYIGFVLGPQDTSGTLSARLGFTPAVFSKFFNFPHSKSAMAELDSFLKNVSEAGGIAMLTLEMPSGLEEVQPSDCEALAELCAQREKCGLTGIFIRFGHEMNGNWYAWGQRPVLYKSKFRMLACAIHASTSRSAMVWAPNYGVGYPFGTPAVARELPPPGSADFAALDTNADGRITDQDDPYEPYYPGDNAVDWVGMTLYHWGVSYPWFKNEMPPPGSFAGSLTGTYQGSTPNFYEAYSVRRRKPLMIAETAAFYNTQEPGPDPLVLKQAWWRQVFASVAGAPGEGFPMLKAINWFDILKQEEVAQNNWIDWRISADPRILGAFVQDLFASTINSHPAFLIAQSPGEDELKIDVKGPAIGLHWHSKTGFVYQLYRTFDLKAWSPVGEFIKGNGGEIHLELPPVDREPIAVYRMEYQAK